MSCHQPSIRTATSGEKVCVIVPSHNRRDVLIRCLDRLFRSSFRPFRVFAILQGCSDGSAQAVAAAFPQVELIHGEDSLWWSGSVNLGLAAGQRAGASHFFLLNDDVCLEPDSLRCLVDISRTHPGAILGSKIFFLDQPDRLWCAGGEINWYGRGLYKLANETSDSPEFSTIREIQWTPGMGTLIPASVLERIGLLDETTFPHYFGDADFCLRARKQGIPIYFCPSSVLHNDLAFGGVMLSQGPLSRQRLKDLFFSLRSHANPKFRLRFWWRHCPKFLIPWQFLQFYLPMAACIAKKVLQWGLSHRVAQTQSLEKFEPTYEPVTA